MKHLFQRHPIALAVCAALALPAAPVMAQGFDVNSAAVREAYVGLPNLEKSQAAIAGFEQIGGGLLPRPPVPNISCLCFVQRAIGFDLDVPNGTTVELSGPRVVRNLTGSGTLQLNQYTLSVFEGNSTFSGSIIGSGGVELGGAGLRLTGANSYLGDTRLDDASLLLVGGGRLHPNSRVIMFGFASNVNLDLSLADGARELGSINAGRSSHVSSTITLGANTLTLGRNNASSNIGADIVGSAGLVKEGTGTLLLSGLNTFAGPLQINGGTVRANTHGLGGGGVVNNGTLVLLPAEYSDWSGSLTGKVSLYSGTISGTGNLVKEGPEAIWLRGRNTYTGGTEIREGVLIGNTDSLQGNIVNNAALAFYQVDNGTYAGTLSGSGTLLQYGPGVLTLTGSNTYTGGTAFSGTLRVTRDDNMGAASGALVMAGGTLQVGADMMTARNIVLASAGGVFDTEGRKLTLSGSVGGPGGLAKTGAGTLTLAGANTYTGTTNVNAGRLEVNGSITSNVSVAAEAELGGTGLIGGNVINRGRLRRGGGMGDTRVAGNFNFEPGSLFTVRADAAGNNDRLVLSGANARATLNGGIVDVRAENGNYQTATRYNIISAQGGVTGQFENVTSNLAFLRASVAYDPNNAYLTLRRNDADYADVAQNANQRAVAQGLTRMANNGTGDAVTVTTVLDGLSATQARAAFDSVGAAGRANLPQVGLLNQRSVNQTLVARLGLVNARDTLAPGTGIASRPLQIAFDESTRSDALPLYAQFGAPQGGPGLRAGDSNTRNGLWLRAYGGEGRLDGDANAPGADYRFGGTLVGYDRKITNDATLGVFAGYAEPRYDQDVATSSARAKSVQVGVYGRATSGAWHVDGVVSYAHNRTNTSRVVTVGALNRAATGSFNGDTWSAHLETGYSFKLSNVEVQPLAALSWVRQTQEAYSESGAGALNLVLPKQDQESLRSTLGVRTVVPFQMGGMQAAFEARTAWAHEFNNTRNINARLAGDLAASAFTVSGPSVPRDSVVLGVGIAAQASRGLRLYADLNTEFNNRSRAVAASVGLRYQW